MDGAERAHPHPSPHPHPHQAHNLSEKVDGAKRARSAVERSARRNLLDGTRKGRERLVRVVLRGARVNSLQYRMFYL